MGYFIPMSESVYALVAPPEIWLKVFSDLDFWSLVALQKTCALFNQIIANNDDVWRSACHPVMKAPTEEWKFLCVCLHVEPCAELSRNLSDLNCFLLAREWSSKSYLGRLISSIWSDQEEMIVSDRQLLRYGQLVDAINQDKRNEVQALTTYLGTYLDRLVRRDKITCTYSTLNDAADIVQLKKSLNFSADTLEELLPSPNADSYRAAFAISCRKVRLLDRAIPKQQLIYKQLQLALKGLRAQLIRSASTNLIAARTQISAISAIVEGDDRFRFDAWGLAIQLTSASQGDLAIEFHRYHSLSCRP